MLGNSGVAGVGVLDDPETTAVTVSAESW